jgi:hypothetical protein
MEGKKYTTCIAELDYKNEVLYVTFNSADMTFEQAKSHVADIRREFKDVLPTLSIGNISSLKNPSKEARDYFGRPEMIEMVKRNAIVADSVLSKIVGNLYLMFSRPTIPTKMFTDEAAALAWLAQYK